MSAEFQDQSKVELIEGICEAKTIIDLFLDNKISEARGRSHNLSSNGQRTMYQELAHSTILFVQAAATLDPKHLQDATDYIKVTLNACSKNRRKGALSETITKQMKKKKIAIYKEYTQEQAHAELCYAEALLQLAFLNMLQDERMTSLVKSSFKVRQCYKCYRICWSLLKHIDWEEGISRSAFESGVRLGVGAFNMMISLLPKRTLKLLEFVGFSGDRFFGLEQLDNAACMRDSLRAPLATLLVLVYDLYATHMLGDTVTSVVFEQPERLKESKGLLDYWNQIYPSSAIFQLLNGRYLAVSGDLEKAIDVFNKSIELPVDWSQYRHMCYWELLWCHALRAEWLDAVQFVEKLACESQWSQATYRYMKAAFLLQFADDPGQASTPQPNQTTFSKSMSYGHYESREHMFDHIDQLLSGIPNLMQRFAGRSLPMEKVALRKSKRYIAQNRKLTLPALELMFIMNAFKLIQCQQDSVMSFLLICENKINELNNNKDEYENYYDDYLLALLLKGVCLRCRGQTFQASMCYQEVIQMKKRIALDTYLAPFCQMELCQLAYEDGDISQAVEHLKLALSYKGYNLESRLHFRMHAMEAVLNKRRKSMVKRSGSDNTIPSKNSHMSDTHSGSVDLADLAQLAIRSESDADLYSINQKPMFPEDEEDEDLPDIEPEDWN